jgi:hypothetical protein
MRIRRQDTTLIFESVDGDGKGKRLSIADEGDRVLIGMDLRQPGARLSLGMWLDDAVLKELESEIRVIRQRRG